MNGCCKWLIFIYIFICIYASIYVLHGDGEPGAESGTYAEPDYHLLDFNFGDDGSISFSSAEYFYDNRECNFDPINFIVGTYYKVSAK